MFFISLSSLSSSWKIEWTEEWQPMLVALAIEAYLSNRNLFSIQKNLENPLF